MAKTEIHSRRRKPKAGMSLVSMDPSSFGGNDLSMDSSFSGAANMDTSMNDDMGVAREGTGNDSGDGT